MRTSSLLSLLCVTVLSPSIPAQTVLGESQKLFGDLPELDDYFGGSAAVHGERLAIGAIGDGTTGSVQVFKRALDGWALEGYLTDPQAFDLGIDLDMDAERVAAGSAYRGVWIYLHGTSGWTLEAQVPRPAYVGFFDGFGARVAIFGDMLVVSATGVDTHGVDAGLVEIYRRSGNQWNLEQELLPALTFPGQHNGSALDVDGNTVVVAAPTYDQNRGAVFVFRELTPGAWTEVQLIQSPATPPTIDYRFGADVQLDGERLIIGEPDNPAGTRHGGLSYVYVREGGNYVLEATLAAGDTYIYDQLGSRVALSGNRALVTALYRDVAYVWERDASGWTNTQRLMRAEDNGYYFGSSAALHGEVAVVGDVVDSGAAHQAGAAFVYELGEDPIGVVLCFGDGSDGPCPCGNESPGAARAGCRSALGEGASLLAAGSLSVSENDLVLGAAIPDPGQPALLLYSNGVAPAVPAGNGLSCLGNSTLRTWTSTPHKVHWGPDLVHALGLEAGAALAFQVFYRDFGGPCHQNFNTTNALQIVMVP